MTANHTPGPWEFRSEPGYCSQIDGADGSVICCFDEDPSEQDARLMEAAPQLLAALQMIAQLNPPLPMGVIEDAEAAIAKATGTNATNPDDNECPDCRGTGEGQFEGQSCGACRGRGYFGMART